MVYIRELDFDAIAFVSGGGANGRCEGGQKESKKTGPRNTLVRNAPTHIYSNPGTVKCAKKIFGGLVKDAFRGVPGTVFDVAKGALVGQCLSKGGNGGGSGSRSSNCSENNAGGTCNR